MSDLTQWAPPSVGARRTPRLVAAALATILATGVVAVLPTQVASAAPQTVSTCGDTGPGSLRAAVAAAGPGDTVSFTVSCPSAAPIFLSSTIDITTSLTIAGPGAAQLVVNGNGAETIFNVATGITVTISGISIDNGQTSSGCGVDCASGGGIENAGTLTVSHSVLDEDHAGIGCGGPCDAVGGGIENESTGALTVSNSTFSNDTANGQCGSLCTGNGGGIYNLGALTVTNSTFTDDAAESFCTDDCAATGGGIENVQGASATVSDSTFSDDLADLNCTNVCDADGGGIDNNGTLGITNSTLEGNNASSGCTSDCSADGGGIDNEAGTSTLTVTNSTLSANGVENPCTTTCDMSGGDVYNVAEANVGATIVANSATMGGDCFLDVALTDLGYNLDDDGSCGFTTADHDLSGTPSGLDPAGLQDNGGPTQTIELQATSAAVDHVAAFLCPTTDQRGSPRIAPCDIGAYDTDGPVLDGSQIHAVIEVETSPSYANDPVHIASSQLQSACGGTITFETLQGATARNPKTSTNSITVILDDDGNVRVVVDGSNCAPGSDLVEADLTVAPFLTALTTVQVSAPAVTPEGVSAYPPDEVETGNTPDSGDSNVSTVFYVETSPVYAEEQVEISSPQLESRCVGGWRFEPGVGAPINQASGTSTAVGTLDDDGNAVFVFKGVSCATGPSAVIADVLAGTHPTYVTTYTVAAPAETVAGSMRATVKATSPAGKAAQKATRQARKARRKQRRQGQGGASGSGTGSAPAPMTMDASPNPLIETGIARTGPPPTLTIVKSDDAGGTSGPPAVEGAAQCNQKLVYTITVTNSGTAALNAVQITDTFSTNPNIVTDSYFAAAGSGSPTGFTASAIGSPYADIDDSVNLPPGSSVVYTVDATTRTSSNGGPLTNTATATPPAGTVLNAGSITSATDTDTLTDCGI